MNFKTMQTFGNEVLCLKFEHTFFTHQKYSFDPSLKSETGRWKIDSTKFDAELSKLLAEKSFGASISEFVFGFEMADFETWGALFAKSASYISYRPKTKTLMCVGQLRWSDVKHKIAAEQLSDLRMAIIDSIKRAASKDRKPKDFSHQDFASYLDVQLANLDIDKVIAIPV
jgi:hypothetical protein